MFHNTFEDLMEEVRTERQSNRENPYKRDIDYTAIGTSLDNPEVFQDDDLFYHILAMDIRAAARPVAEDVAEQVFNSNQDEIIDTSNRYLNRISDDYLSQNKVHSNPDAVGAALIYISSLLNDQRRNQQMISEAADVTTNILRDRYEGLTEDQRN